MNVIITNRAKFDLSDIADYIQAKFSNKEVLKFFDLIDFTIEILKKNPEAGKQFQDSIFRQILVSRQTYLFYYLDNDNIVIVTFFNNSQNPDKLNRILFS